MELSIAEKYKQITTADVAELLGVSKATVWRYVNRGVLPQPQYISPKRPKWKLGEVIETYEQSLQMSDIGMTGSKANNANKTPETKVIEKKQEQTLGQKLKAKFGI